MVDAADRTLLSVVSLFLLIPSKMVSGMEPRGDELVFTLEHCLTEGADASFLPRGTIFVKSLKSLSATFSQREPLSPSELDKLRDLASRNGHYRIRLQPKSGQDNSDVSDGSVTTVVKACALFASQLTETITLSLDNTGHLYGVGLIVPDRGCHLKTFNWDSASLPFYFNTSVSVVLQGTGQLPDTQTYIQKMEREKREKATGKTQDNRSFLAKYWMYIVPVVIVMMLSSQPPENQGEGGSQ
ncbi:ER membrane protein complex subunit 10-like [Acropora millepora]|uniref:ER membrane protein complex subunit 10-like n=1 Tax=Acropora millepora TaxID=45264 RepID=UPI001CF5ACEB|nr:ER membrane protein complex subunit 10-like [Acropora millepora]